MGVAAEFQLLRCPRQYHPGRGYRDHWSTNMKNKRSLHLYSEWWSGGVSTARFAHKRRSMTPRPPRPFSMTVRTPSTDLVSKNLSTYSPPTRRAPTQLYNCHHQPHRYADYLLTFTITITISAIATGNTAATAAATFAVAGHLLSFTITITTFSIGTATGTTAAFAVTLDNTLWPRSERRDHALRRVVTVRSLRWQSESALWAAATASGSRAGIGR